MSDEYNKYDIISNYSKKERHEKLLELDNLIQRIDVKKYMRSRPHLYSCLKSFKNKTYYDYVHWVIEVGSTRSKLMLLIDLHSAMKKNNKKNIEKTNTYSYSEKLRKKCEKNS